MRKEVLRMENIFVYNLNRTILEDFRLYVFEGEIISLIGLSGQGKTALYNILCGEKIIEKGRIIFNNKVYNEKQSIMKNRGILCLGNKSILIDNLSIAENLFIVGYREYKSIFINYNHIIYKTEKLLAKYVPNVKANTLIKELSLWEVKMVELCKAIIMKPKLVVIDEAILSCSEEQVDKILDILSELRHSGISIIYESNKVNKLTRMSDRMFIVRNGNNVKILYKNQYSDILINNYLVGYDMPLDFKRKSIVDTERILTFKDITVQDNLKNINLSLNKGEIIGIFQNENLLNQKVLDIITGETNVISGEILFENKRFTPKSLEYAKKKGIGIIPRGLNNDYIIKSMNKIDNLTLYFIKRFSVKGIFVDDTMIKFILKDLKESLENSEFKEILNRPSYMDQLILLYREIICNNKIIICVNPFERADIIMKKIIYSTLDKSAQQGAGIIVINNNIMELQDICDTIYIINNNGEMHSYKIR